MKVLIITPCDLPVPAVMGGAVQTLVESLIRVNEKYKDMELTIISSENEVANAKAISLYQTTRFIRFNQYSVCKVIDTIIDTIKNIITHRDKRYTNEYFRKIYLILKIRQILENNNFDKVILQNSGFLLQIFQKKALVEKYKGRIYYHLHNVPPQNINRMVLSKCHILLISDFLRNKTEEILKSSIADRYSLVKNGIPSELFSNSLGIEEKENLLESLNIPDGKIIFIFAGRLIPQKGIDKVLSAVHQINNRNIILLVVGSAFFDKKVNSEYAAMIQSKCNDMKENVRFTGYVPYHEMWKYYALSDAAILPSMWEEPAGLTIIEAMIAGLPIISTVSGGIPEYVDDKSAILLERNDQIVGNLVQSINEIAKNLQNWKALAINARKIACEVYSEEAFYKRFLVAISK